MRSRNKLVILSMILVSAAALVACGDGPFSSSKDGVVLKGTILGNGATGASAFSAGSGGSTDPIIVTVDGHPEITTTVGPDGSFTLRGLPTGDFTLIFTQGSATLGTATFSTVKPNQEITIKIVVNPDGTVTVVEEKRNGIGHADIEIEGEVEAVLLLDPLGESRFMIDGYTVVALPGQTAIREGNTARTVADVTVGRQVHVKGEWLDPEVTGVQPVLAHEIKLQDDEDDDDDDDNDDQACMIHGGKVGKRIELEGNVASGTPDAFQLDVNGDRSTNLVDVDASTATFQCSGGKKGPTPAECKASVVPPRKVHVSGTLLTCDATSAEVMATKVIVQK